MKIGIAGLGKQGRTLIDDFPNNITHCYDPYIKNDLGLIQVDEYTDLLQHVDAVVIASPHKQHADQTLEAIQANKHVFVEKPIALKIADIKQIELALKEHNVVVRQNLKYRYLYEKTPALGKVYYVQLSYTRRRGVPLTPFFVMQKFADLGVLADLGGHLVDMAFYLSGWPDVRTVNSQLLNMSKDLPSPIGTDSGWTDWNEELDGEIHRLIDVEDRCFINVSCDGCLMSFDIGWIGHQKEDDKFFLKIVGGDGTLYAHRMEVIKSDGETEIIGHCDDSELNKMSIEDFLAEINGEPIKIAQSIKQWSIVTQVIGL